jgi:two-component system cell cycle sensor histidine kinase/response regulator CckA
MAMTILVVEDSPTQAAQLSFLLEEAGYRVVVAPDGERAIEMLTAEGFDLIVSDVTMPGIDGYEVCRRIKVDHRRDVPVILLTSLGDPMDIVRGLEAGADNYVTKPYEAEHLLLRVRHVLENRALRRSSKSKLGVTVCFLGRTFTINSDREQILDLLISTFEDAVLQNRQLREREEELQLAKAQLARYAGALEDRLHSILQSVPEVLFSFNSAATELHYASPACRRVFGLTPEEFAADPGRWQAVVHEDDRGRIVAQYDRLVRDARTGTAEFRVVHRDGTSRWVQATFIPVADESGRTVRVDGIASDITERRLLEQQVRQAQKMEAVGTLAGGVAHDFNNVLAAIRSTADLALLDLPGDSALAEEFRQIRETVDRGAALTRQLLTVGRGQVREPQPVDVSALVDHTRKMLDRVIGETIRLNVQFGPEPTTVIADPGQLEQVLLNLCINARDAMPSGGELAILTERVTLDREFRDLHPWAEEGDYVLLMVSDTGTGMPVEVQARIFEPFFTTKETGRGTGLGLAVVYGIVKQHGGMIHVYSEPGQGTTFRIYLPFNAVGPAAASAVVSTPLPTGQGMVLLAEDDEVLRSTTSKLLARLGYEPVVAADGREALALLEREGGRIQLAILDVVMPELGGPAVAERAQERWPHLRYVFTSGYSPSSLHLAHLRGVPIPVLQKPYGVTALAQTVSQALAPPATAP